MNAWRKIKKDKYAIRIGPANITIESGKFGWYTMLWDEKTYIPMTESLKDDQAAALAWARQVLGAALVEAGADIDTIGVCEKCGAKGPGRHCMYCSGEGIMNTMTAVRYARIGA